MKLMEFGFYYYLCHIKGFIIFTVFEMSRHKNVHSGIL